MRVPRSALRASRASWRATAATRRARRLARPFRPPPRNAAVDRRRLVREPLELRPRLRLAVARTGRADRPRVAREGDAGPFLRRRPGGCAQISRPPAADGPAHAGVDPARTALAPPRLR